MALLGIDLGTTNSLACVYRNGRAELIPNAQGTYKTRSAVSCLEDGTVLVGDAAAERLASHPEDSAASFKLWMGTERAIPLGGRTFQPEELSALVLRQLRLDAERYLGEPVEEAVISVPAYFNDNQRCATKLAAQLAGLKVERLINEPSAAALYYRRGGGEDDCRMMIVDFGGGTLDVSIVECFENIIEITAIAGDNHLGGGDIDRAIAAHFCQENGLGTLPPDAQAALLRQAETAKLTLSGAPAAVLALELEGRQYSLLLNKALLRRLCEPVFRRVREVVGKAMKNRERQEKLDRVVLVGGSSRLEVFVDFLEELFGRRPETAERTDEIVALGVGLCAGIKERSEDLKELVMTDVCPFSLGVATCNDAKDRTPHMAFLIQRSSMLPASRQDRFYTLHENQRALRFEIYQGEGYYVSENLKLGELEVRVPPGPAGSQYAAVTFTYDIDGVLHVSVSASGGDKRERLILNPKLRLEGEALEKARERIEQIRLAAQGTPEEQRLLERVLGLYGRAVGRRREALGRTIDWYRSVQGDPIAREKARRRLEEELERLEAWLEEDPEFWSEDDGNE